MSSKPSVLNPMLYHRLLRRFGEVKVRHRGEKRIVRPDLLSDEPKLVVRQWGESYYVCCPLCHDNDFKLSISYMYGQLDDTGRHLTNLAYCHANNCLRKSENKFTLAEMLNAQDGILEDARILSGKVLSDEERIPALPAPRTRIDQLPKGPPPRRWLKRQGFDPDKLARMYELSFCPESEDPLTRDRIIIPVSMRGKHQGWHSLALDPSTTSGERRSRPKYLSAPGMATSTLLYNLDRAREYETCVIVKEPIRVWAFGRMAVCALGGTMSEKQQQLMKAVFCKKRVILLQNEADKDSLSGRCLRTAVQRCLSGNLIVAEHPANVPPGTKGRQVLREFVTRKAEERGFSVSFEKGA